MDAGSDGLAVPVDGAPDRVALTGSGRLVNNPAEEPDERQHRDDERAQDQDPAHDLGVWVEGHLRPRARMTRNATFKTPFTTAARTRCMNSLPECRARLWCRGGRRRAPRPVAGDRA